MGSRGGLGTTTSRGILRPMAPRPNSKKERTALIDLDLHFGTVALCLDTDPGSGLCEALEQPLSRIDSLFVERAMVKVSDTLRILAAEAPVGDAQIVVDTGAIDVLLYELRRKLRLGRRRPAARSNAADAADSFGRQAGSSCFAT